MIEINGMAHLILTASRFEEALGFYGKLMPFMGLKEVFRGDDFGYWVGGRTALGVRKREETYRDERFVQYRVGLHHFCLRARRREDVDATAQFLREMGATIVRGPMEGDWAPGYYYVLFEDPDGIRGEICHVPGAGVLSENTAFDGGADFSPASPA
jgi:catechol 2,3-dioxygenase-like lactoylglutathione lyase family enzyme